MSVSEILADLFFIQRGYLNGNHFVYGSDTPVLIDTGYVSDFDQTASMINSAGVDYTKTRLIINTHSHCDHIGGNRIIQNVSGCKVAMHKVGKYFMDMRDSWSTWARYYVQDADFFDCAVGLEDGDKLFIGSYQFEVIYTPGHASDGIALYNPDEGILFSSDTLWEYDMAVITTRVEGSRALFCMLESIDKIAKLKVDTVYPGHGNKFHDFASAIRRARARLLRFMKDPASMGVDLIKKIIVYTVMMKKQTGVEVFFKYLMTTPWYPETVNLYFSGEYEKTFNSVMNELIDREIIYIREGRFFTTVIP